MKISSYKELQSFLNKLENKPKLLLHSCCAPCSTHTIKFLMKYFDITIFYSNDNIYPLSEYQKRLDEQIRYASILGIKVMFDDYNDLDYYKKIKGYELLGEHSQRCYLCYELRMEKTCLEAIKGNFDFFTTTLSISPHKNSQWINEIGYRLEEKYNVKYLYSDYKKENGYQDSIKISKEENLYRQDYCGCVYSLNERGNKI